MPDICATRLDAQHRRLEYLEQQLHVLTDSVVMLTQAINSINDSLAIQTKINCELLERLR